MSTSNSLVMCYDSPGDMYTQAQGHIVHVSTSMQTVPTAMDHYELHKKYHIYHHNDVIAEILELRCTYMCHIRYVFLVVFLMCLQSSHTFVCNVTKITM